MENSSKCAAAFAPKKGARPAVAIAGTQRNTADCGVRCTAFQSFDPVSMPSTASAKPTSLPVVASRLCFVPYTLQHSALRVILSRTEFSGPLIDRPDHGKEPSEA
jgi:hypothetical protein